MGLTQAFDYYAWDENAMVEDVLTGQGGRLKTLNAGTLQSLSYLYDAAGNVRQIGDTPTNEIQAFGYDVLNRLTSATATGGPAPYGEGYTYDPTTGNLQTKSGLTYTYSTNHPHAVSTFNGNMYDYDANGNMTVRHIASGPLAGDYSLGYDAENRLVSVPGPNGFAASFVYNGDGQRVQSTINGVTTTFAGNYYEVSGGAATKYYYAGAARIAMRTSTNLYYLLGDHLGSTSLTTDASGNLVSELRYGAWGETRFESGATPTTYRYTGQREEASFGLYFYRARWYDPAISRFSSADTIIPSAGDPQAWDRYAYANNSPSRFTDPSGHRPCDGPYGCSGEQASYRVGRSNKWHIGEDYVPLPQPISGRDQMRQDCSWSGAFSDRGCDLHYMSIGLGLDAPTLMMLSGLGISLFAPEVGVPLGLTGAAFEACAFTATPFCAAVKLASVNGVFTLDKDGNLYAGPQLSWGKSILPIGAVSWNGGIYPTEDGHIPNETEMEDSLQGFSTSVGTLATGGISYSPFAQNHKTAYYLVGAPEIFSVNVQYNWLVYDFSP